MDSYDRYPFEKFENFENSNLLFGECYYIVHIPKLDENEVFFACIEFVGPVEYFDISYSTNIDYVFSRLIGLPKNLLYYPINDKHRNDKYTYYCYKTEKIPTYLRIYRRNNICFNQFYHFDYSKYFNIIHAYHDEANIKVFTHCSYFNRRGLALQFSIVPSILIIYHPVPLFHLAVQDTITKAALNFVKIEVVKQFVTAISFVPLIDKKEKLNLLLSSNRPKLYTTHSSRRITLEWSMNLVNRPEICKTENRYIHCFGIELK